MTRPVQDLTVFQHFNLHSKLKTVHFIKINESLPENSVHFNLLSLNRSTDKHV